MTFQIVQISWHQSNKQFSKKKANFYSFVFLNDPSYTHNEGCLKYYSDYQY